jgi:signal transduction histidine kinase
MTDAARLAARPWFRWLAVAGAVGLLVLTEAHAASVGAPLFRFIVPDAVGGLAFIGAGAVAWTRRPSNFTGPLLVASGALWFVGSSEGSPVGALASLSYSFGGYYDPVLAFLALAFPVGRLHGAAGRIVVLGMVGVMGLRTVVRLLFNEPAIYYDCPCPPNPFLVALNQPLYEGVDQLATAALAGLAAAAAVLLGGRLRTGTRAARRVSRPVVVAGVVAMAMAAYQSAARVALPALGLDLFPTGETSRHVVVWALFAGRVLIPVGFLLGVLRLRGGRGVVADLVLDLSEPLPRERLRAPLAQALGDPSLEVAYWSEEGGYVDEAGGPVILPADDDEGRAVTVIQGGGHPLAVLIHDRSLLEDPGLVQSVGAAVRMAVENERLRARLEEQLAEVRASRARIVAAADEERRRVERDLHDGAQQRLLTLSLALRVARSQASGREDPDLQETLAGADEELRQALAEIRELARGIHPVVLSRAGLAAALRSLAERASVPVEITGAPSDRYPAPVEAAVYFVVSEALANVGKHARASRAAVSVSTSDDVLRVEVSDDGVGAATTSGGSGLLGLRDRVSALGGWLRVDSPPGEGTTVSAEIPLQGDLR